MKKSAASTLITGTAIIFVLVSGASSQAQSHFTDVSTQVGLIQEAKHSWGNPVWGDINNDGYLDLIVPCHGLSSSHGPFVYLNNAGLSFTDIRTTCGIGLGPELDSRDWHGFSFGDYDNDGNLDLYIAEGAKGSQGGIIKRDLLFQGHGNGTFTYVSDTSGIETSLNRGRCGFWFDYNNDGKLDLFVKNYGGYNPLYQNNGDGTFTTLSVAGLSDAVNVRDADFGSIMSFADYDNDGDLDVMITGDGDSMELYRNNGDGTFTDVNSAAGIVSQDNGKGVAWGDYDNDGYPDLFIARGHQGGTGAGGTLFHNNGNGTFTDVTSSAGVSISGSCWAAVWGDYDNDGYLDLFITNAGDTGQGPGNHNYLFHNNGNGTFTDVAAATGAALQDDTSLHKGACWVDFDNDGFLDLTVKDGIGNEGDNGPGAFGLHRLLRNSGNSNHYLEINLRGVQSNGRGIGARVTVTSANGVAYRQNNGGGGGEYASQGSQPLHFGLGAATTATVVVNWPSGVVDTQPGVQVNQIITVTEGSSTGTPTPTPTPTPSPTPTVTPTPTATPTVQVRVQTNPAGRSFIVDSTVYTSTQVFSWASGSSHTIATTSPQSGGTGIQYTWQRWNDHGAISHTIAPTTTKTYTATFSTQYYLTTTQGTGGTVKPASGWRKSGAGISIRATPANGYSFSSWTGTGSGSYSGTNNPASITMNGPITENATFKSN